MQLVFLCPECSAQARLVLTDEDVESVKAAILKDGRSPTFITRCVNGHELLVTLYFRDNELGVRDVVVPLGSTDAKGDRKPPSELDWLKRTFGGSK